MASHALYPALDSHHIASQSRYVLGRLLRERLGFRGVIVTDSLEARAVTLRPGPGTAAVRSVRAGADLVLTTRAGSHLRVLRALQFAARFDLPTSTPPLATAIVRGRRLDARLTPNKFVLESTLNLSAWSIIIAYLPQ